MKRICVQCGKEFELAKSEMDFYRRKKLAYPKRCKECRAENRKKLQVSDGNQRKWQQDAAYGQRDAGRRVVNMDGAMPKERSDRDMVDGTSDTGTGAFRENGISAASPAEVPENGTAAEKKGFFAKLAAAVKGLFGS